ncbi:hypothetical protein BpHYR1_022084 [Brachionus plicatilis]|uniref:Uncharacterized protein n=1 Tax=Brachionus plicatilis TaxID=10195 RepID=A0A3M7RZ57_BRAPC|nr:hypothetical protein BpHYR1_022084 [Brachionus plicatilis]
MKFTHFLYFSVSYYKKSNQQAYNKSLGVTYFLNRKSPNWLILHAFSYLKLNSLVNQQAIVPMPQETD